VRKAYIVLVLLVSLVLLNGCVLEGIWRRLPTEFRGVVANESSYTLEIRIYDTDANKLIYTTTLAPDHYTITHLDERNYTLRSERAFSDIYHKTAYIHPNAIKADCSYDGVYYDWRVIFRDGYPIVDP